MVERQPREVRLDRTFAALADSTRRAILRRLRRGEASVGELAAPFPISFNAVSKHVRVLEEAGLVKRRIEGREHRLRLRGRPLRSVVSWTEDYAEFWEDRLDALEAQIVEGRKRS